MKSLFKLNFKSNMIKNVVATVCIAGTVAIVGVSSSSFATNETNETDNKTAEADNGSYMQYVDDVNVVLRNIREYYVDNISDDTVLLNGLKGMARSLKGYSSYLSEEDYKKLQLENTPNYSGIGVELDNKQGFVISNVYKNSTAEKAGLLNNDVVISIDDELVSASTESLQDIKERLIGKVGSSVTVGIFRPSDLQMHTIEVKRAKLSPNSVTSKYFDPNLLYIKIDYFTDKTFSQLLPIVSKVNNSSVQVILDLRNNSGTYNEALPSIAGLFLPAGQLIYYTLEHNDKRTNYKAIPTGNRSPLVNNAVAIMINNVTASASELLVGAIKSYGHAIVVGDKTAGRGLAQDLFQVSAHSYVMLPYAQYYSPDGVAIQDNGIKPDVYMNQSSIKRIDSSFSYSEKNLKGHLSDNKENASTARSKVAVIELDSDNQLEATINLLRGLKVSLTTSSSDSKTASR